MEPTTCIAALAFLLFLSLIMKNRRHLRHGKPKRQPLGELDNVQPLAMPIRGYQVVKRSLNEYSTEGLRASKRRGYISSDCAPHVSVTEKIEEGSFTSIPVQVLTQKEAENFSYPPPQSASRRGVGRSLSELSSRCSSPEQPEEDVHSDWGASSFHSGPASLEDSEEDVQSDWSESSFPSRPVSPQQPEKEADSSLSEVSSHPFFDDQPENSLICISPPAEVTHTDAESSFTEPSSPSSPPELPEISVCSNPPLSETLPASRSSSTEYNLDLTEPVRKEGEGNTECLILNLPTEIIYMIILQSQGLLECVYFALTCRTLLGITSRCLGGLSLEKRKEAYNGIFQNIRNRFGTKFPICCYSVMRYRKLWRNLVLRKTTGTQKTESRDSESCDDIRSRDTQSWDDTDSLDTQSWGDTNSIPILKVQKFIKKEFIQFPPIESHWGEKLSLKDFYLMSTVLHQAEIVVKALSTTAIQNTADFEKLGHQHHNYNESSPVLTQDEKSRFLEAVLQYEFYCCVYFYKGDAVFQDEIERHQRFFDNRNYSRVSDIFRFYSVVECVYTFYHDLLKNMRHTALNNTTDLKVMYFRLANWQMVLRFVHYLLRQGIRPFAKVYVMDSHRQMEFLFGEFFEYEDNKTYPEIHVWGNGFNVGADGEAIWTPWAYSGKVSGPAERLYLRTAFALWDFERLDKTLSTVATTP